MSGKITWKCQICGYIYEGEIPPEKCPVCGWGREKFVKINSELPKKKFKKPDSLK